MLGGRGAAAMFRFTGAAAAKAGPGVNRAFAAKGRAAGLATAQIGSARAEADQYLRTHIDMYACGYTTSPSRGSVRDHGTTTRPPAPECG